MIKAIILVGLGGGAGSILRYMTSMFVLKYFNTVFPWATLVVNVLGCLTAGFIIGFFEHRQILNPDLRILLITGFCGGYTTFSAFSVENIKLFQSGNTLLALIYLTSSIFFGLFAVWLGGKISQGNL
jgi:CrcB protein